MRRFSKTAVIIISFSLIAVYFLPMWEIALEAPQYPEGLGLLIWINKITGDLETINSLNHYIGMKTIQPDSIKELSIMPYLLGFLIAMGIATGISGKKKFLMVWVFIFILLGASGAIDFYLWEYDYGHNLDPNAAIKVPGMTYQPPLFGSKELLNFVAHSYPDSGGWIMIASGFLSTGILFYEIKFNKTTIQT